MQRSYSGSYGPGKREQVYLVLTGLSDCENIVTVNEGQGTLTLEASRMRKAMASKDDTVMVPLCGFEGYMEHVELTRGGSKQETISHRYPVRGTISAYHTGHLSDDHVTSGIRGRALLDNVSKLGLAFRDPDEQSNWFNRSLDPENLTTDLVGESQTDTFRFPVKEGLPLMSGAPCERRISLSGVPVDTTMSVSLLHGMTVLNSNTNDGSTIPGLAEVFDGLTGLKGQSRAGFLVQRSISDSESGKVSDEQMIEDATSLYNQSPPGIIKNLVKGIIESEQATERSAS